MSSSDLSLLNGSKLHKFSIGDAVYVGCSSDRVGTIAFIGNTEFAEGEWIGVKLNAPNGKNDGSVNNVTYFECEPNFGLFTRRGLLKPVSEIPIPTMENHVNGASAGAMPSLVPEDSAVALKVGDRVLVSGSRVGTIRFIGSTEFAVGEWVGIELEEPLGKNDGAVKGRRYFACKPNHGLFSAPSKITLFNGKTPARPVRRGGSRESLMSIGSNFSSVSRQRIKPNMHARRTPGQGSIGDPCVHVLESVIKEKEAHIEQLMQEFEMERSELAKVASERGMFEMEAVGQCNLIGQLQRQIEELQIAAIDASEENSKLKDRIHEEIRKSEELQFRLQEEAIEKTALENQKSEVEERVFELEEALAAAKETNERIELQLSGASSSLSSPQTMMPEDAQMASSEARIVELEATLIKMQEELLDSDAKELVSMRDAEIQQLQTQLSDLQASLLKAEQHIAVKALTDGEAIEVLRVAQVAEEELVSALNQQRAILSAEEERVVCEEANTLADQLARAESELQSMRTKVVELEKYIAEFDEENVMPADARKAILSAPLQLFPPHALLNELQIRIAKEEATSEESDKWTKRLLDLAEEVRKVKGLERESDDEAIAEALQQMNIKLLKVEAELAQKEFCALEQMTALTETQLSLQKAQETSPSEAPVVKELYKRLETLEVERSQLTTALSERQQEILLLQETLNKTGSEANTYAQSVARLENELSVAVDKRNKKLEELKAAIGNKEGSGLTDEELLQRISYLRQHNEELEHQYAESEARIKSLASQHSQVLEEYQSLKSSITSMYPIDERIMEMQHALDKANYRVEISERSSAAALQQLESKNLELQSLQERLLKLAKDHEDFQDKQVQLITSLETEKRIYMERLRRAEKKVERFEKEEQVKSSHSPTPPPPMSNGRGAPRALAGGSSTHDSYDSQVNFLNSVIVDLHSKNAELEQRLRDAIDNSANVGIGEKQKTKEASKKALPKMRYWCDNCEVFDLHDTEQCPKEPTVAQIRSAPKLAHQVGRPGDRIYCQNCGTYDKHTSSICAEDPQFTF